MTTETAQLLERANSLAGLTFAELADQLQRIIPSNTTQAKGWMGGLIETYLGATAGPRPLPDFPELGIELKTIPINFMGKPLESTYVCVVPLQFDDCLHFQDALVYKKLAHVLWVPIEGGREKSIAQRRIGQAFLWQPSPEDLSVLHNDWEEHMEKVRLGHIQSITAYDGTYLQIRPKAANRHCKRLGIDAIGQLSPTLPLGFYLRPSFTQKILLSVNEKHHQT